MTTVTSAAIPAAQRLTLGDQGHVPEPEAFAAVLTRFFAGGGR